MVKQNTKEKMQDVAKQRIYRLFQLAKAESSKHPGRSNRYVELARKIGTRYNVRFTKDLKTQFCKQCGSFWVQGKTVTTRTNSQTKAVEYTCSECKTVKRFGYSKEAKAKA